MQIVDLSGDTKKLIYFYKGNYRKSIESIITPFCSSDKIYKWTNENMNIYPNENLEGKKILTITSSGDHTLDAILKGATNIDSIDINVFCKYYSALKIAMIKKYDYSDFLSNIYLFTNEYFNSKKRQILEDVSIYLTKEELEFWDTYVRLTEISSNMIFWECKQGPKGNSYYKEENYNSLKEKVSEVQINYYDADIINIDSILSNKSYDYIYLSNIISRIDTNTKEKDRIELLEKILKIMNEDGIIYNYYLWETYRKIKKMFGEYYGLLKNKFHMEYHDCNKKVAYHKHGILTMKKK